MLKIVLATTNQNKVRELNKILAGLNVQIFTPEDFPGCPETVEDGSTFLENALKKANTVYKHTGLLSLADDSGLEVDVLNGAPGIYSARFAGEKAEYHDNNQKLLDLLKDIPDEKRSAQFHCSLALIGDGIKEAAEGICRGRIIREYRGKDGFGYDPLFLYEPAGLTFAELSPEEKNKISHRAIAFNKMRNIIENILERKSSN